jgi:hypothetical protein
MKEGIFETLYCSPSDSKFYCLVIVTHFDYWGTDNNLAFKEKKSAKMPNCPLGKGIQKCPKTKGDYGYKFSYCDTDLMRYCTIPVTDRTMT